MIGVTVYSAPWCSGCKVVKKSLEQDNLKFTEIDISTTDGIQAAKLADIKSIPVTVVQNDFVSDVKMFIGSKPETIRQILEAIGD